MTAARTRSAAACRRGARWAKQRASDLEPQRGVAEPTDGECDAENANRAPRLQWLVQHWMLISVLLALAVGLGLAAVNLRQDQKEPYSKGKNLAHDAREYLDKADLSRTAGENDAALQWYREAIEKLEIIERYDGWEEVREGAGENRSVPVHRNDLPASYYNLGSLQEAMGEHAEALASYQKAVEIGEKFVQDNPSIIEYQVQLARSYNGRGISQRGGGQPYEAITSHQRAIEICERLARENPQLPEHQIALADSIYQKACALAKYVSVVGSEKDELSAEELVVRQTYADQSVEALRQAIAAGYKDFDKLKTDSDLTVIRVHPGYKQLVSSGGQ